MDPYRIPEHDKMAVIHFSGGKTSGYLLAHILKAHGGKLPDNAIAVFCNTGKEVERTYRFIHDFSEQTGQHIVWLEFDIDPEGKGTVKSPAYIHKVVDYKTASRGGEPFEKMIRRKKFVPNVVNRICTSVLKVETCDRYMRRDLGIKEYRDIIGFRYDEPRRWNRSLKMKYSQDEKCRHTLRDFPLVHAGVTKGTVEDYWRDIPWGLRMDSNYGNCDLCYLKGRRKLVSIIREKPELADWWIDMETKVVGMRREKSTSKTFMKDTDYAELKMIATSGKSLLEVDDRSPHGDLPCFCFD